MDGLPDYLSSGERARLIPVVADTSKEARATSVLLATMVAIEPFSQVLLSSLGQRVGSRTKIECFTEIVFKNQGKNSKIRPDGLLILSIGNRTWRAIFEAKVGNAKIDETQISAYCQLAKENSIDAVVTLSNEFCALPTHHPLSPTRNITHGVPLFHWSWMHILTQAILLLHDHDFEHPDELYLLSETVRYFQHDKVGVSRFDRMNSEWKDLVEKVKTGAALNRNDNEVENSVAAWHQEQRDLCLLISRKLSRHVSQKLSRTYIENQSKRLRDDCNYLIETNTLCSTLVVPDAAAPIEIIVDLRRRTITCMMSLDAPKDKLRPTARINWVVRQLSDANPHEIRINAKWPGKAKDTQATLQEIQEDPSSLVSSNSSGQPHRFDVMMIRDLAGKFSGPKTFIEQLEEFVPNFYHQVGEHLQSWIPSPPKLKEEKIIEGVTPSIDSSEEMKSATENSDSNH